jgi:hypothetical protein
VKKIINILRPLEDSLDLKNPVAYCTHTRAARHMWDRQDRIQETNKVSVPQSTGEVCCGKNIIQILDMTNSAIHADWKWQQAT